MDDFMTGFVAGQGDNNRDNGGMFGGEGFMFLIVILALMGGGNGGLFGGGRDGGVPASKSDLCDGFNFNNLERNVQGVQNGLCDGFYAQNTTLMNGFHGVDNGLCNISRQISDCCCETNRNIDQSRYEASKNTCDIITAGHSDADRILAFLTNDKIEGLRDRAMQAEAQLSQMAQSRFIVDQVRPCPVPSYPTCNPWGCQGQYGVGYGNGGCGNGCC